MEINNDGILYYFTKEPNEINDMFYKRCRFASTLKPKTHNAFINSIKQSKIKIHEEYYNCKFTQINK